MVDRSKSAALPVYDPATRYDVRLTRVVTAYGVPFYPIDDHDMDGATLNLIVETEGADCVDRADPR